MALSPGIDIIRQHLTFLESKVLGILLFGSYVQGQQSVRSDIDLCIVAPQIKNHSKVFLKVLEELADPRVDVHFFELLPLYLKMSVVENHIVLLSQNVCILYEYFYQFRKIWKDQRHRQQLSSGEIMELIKMQRGVQLE